MWEIGRCKVDRQKKNAGLENQVQQSGSSERTTSGCVSPRAFADSTRSGRGHLWGLTERSASVRRENRTGSSTSLPFPKNSELGDGSWVQANANKLVIDESDVSLILAATDADKYQPILRIPEYKVKAEELQKKQRELDALAKMGRTNPFIRQPKPNTESAGTSQPSESSTTRDMRVIAGAEALVGLDKEGIRPSSDCRRPSLSG